MFNHQTYGVRVGDTLDPAEVKTVHCWYRRTGYRTRRGINGGQIDLLKLSIGDEITGWYSDGEWSIPVTDPHSKKALDKLLKRWN